MVELYTIICQPQHSTSLTAVLLKLLAQEKLCDVTLLCSGGNIKAHQIILSAGSSYFEDMFVQNPHPHPIVHLPNVHVNEMRNMVKFIYHGEITLPMNDLPDFILKAQSFQVRRMLGLKYVQFVKSSEYIMGNLSGDEDTVQISISELLESNGNYPTPECNSVDNAHKTLHVVPDVVIQRYGNNTEVDGQLDDSMDDQENCYMEDLQQQQVDQSGEIPSTPEEGTNFATEEMELYVGNDLPTDTTRFLENIERPGTSDQDQTSLQNSPEDRTNQPGTSNLSRNIETKHQGGSIQLPDEPVTTNSTVLPPNFVVGRNETSVSNPSSSRTFERPVPSEQQIRIPPIGYRRASHTVSDTHSRCKICNELVRLTNRHYIIHFPRFFICTLCPAIYKKRATLATHYKLKHPELTSERM
uniref:BTB domain-containing protein n=1 Tax=Anopheles quadriannulatus TaxID=34691 RepID=A0A182XCU5_ANOQN